MSWVEGLKRGVSTRSRARREQPHVVAVLVHDGEALDPLVLRTGLVDEDDARVEIALLAGDALIDHIGDDVADAAGILRPREELLAGQLRAGEHVPKPELGLEPAVGGADAPDDQGLRIDRAPILEARRARRRRSICSMKAAGSIGANSPDDLRSFATTSEISRADFRSAIEPSLANSVTAIGSGWMLPSVMLSSTTACAGVCPAERSDQERQGRTRRPGEAARPTCIGAPGSVIGSSHV